MKFNSWEFSLFFLIVWGVYLCLKRKPQNVWLLVAGPIERACNLLPQFATDRNITPAQFYSGIQLIFWGFFKKIFIANGVGFVGFNNADQGISPLGCRKPPGWCTIKNEGNFFSHPQTNRMGKPPLLKLTNPLIILGL